MAEQDALVLPGRILEGEELATAKRDLHPQFREIVERDDMVLVAFYTSWIHSRARIRYAKKDQERMDRLADSLAVAMRRGEMATYSWEDKGAWETVKN